MADPRGFDRMKEEWERDPKYQVEVKTEASYYEDQAGTLTTFIRILGTLITVVMSIGAMFGAMNTMYAAVGSRSREIATLRALGFRRREILASFLLESLAISAAGGALGCLLALPINGVTTSTINWDTFSELAFAFRVTPAILAWGFAFALVMGAAGGLLPALRAARTPIVAALRQV
jgi:ABC-type antimicrobial peptide transport system permease subunit